MYHHIDGNFVAYAENKDFASTEGIFVILKIRVSLRTFFNIYFNFDWKIDMQRNYLLTACTSQSKVY